MDLRPARRLAYRAAYKILLWWWFLWRPRLRSVAVALLHRDRVLLVRHSYQHRGQWDFPGGGTKRGEAPRDAAKREAWEELGVVLDDLIDLGVEEVVHNHRHDAIHLFLARCRTDAAIPDSTEIEEARWFLLEEVPRDLSPVCRRLLPRALPALKEHAARRGVEPPEDMTGGASRPTPTAP